MALALVVQTEEGVEGANVYDDLASIDTFLGDYGYTAFVGKSTPIKTRIAIEATRNAEHEIEDRVDGWPVDPDQSLLHPRENATDSRNRLIEGIPDSHRQGLMLLMEHMAAAKTTRMTQPGAQTGNVRAERIDGWSVMYGKRDMSFADLYPDVWSLLSQGFPRGVRSRRA